jgi:cell division protein FtsN
MNTFMGFGDVAMQTAVATQQPTFWDKINNVITKVVQPAANVYTQVTNKPSVPGVIQQPAPYVTNTNSSTPPPPAQEEKDNTKKYLLIGTGVILAGTAIFLVTRKSKKSK